MVGKGKLNQFSPKVTYSGYSEPMLSLNTFPIDKGKDNLIKDSAHCQLCINILTPTVAVLHSETHSHNLSRVGKGQIQH